MPDNIALGVANSLATGGQSYELLFKQLSYNPKTKSNKNNNLILSDTCGFFKAGRLTAVLGPSGAGKTTLLNVLSGFK